MIGGKKKYEMIKYTGNSPRHKLNGQFGTIGPTKLRGPTKFKVIFCYITFLILDPTQQNILNSTCEVLVVTAQLVLTSARF